MPSHGPTPPRLAILGVEISAVQSDAVLTLCRQWIADRVAGHGGSTGRSVYFLPVHSIMTARRDGEFMQSLNSADLAVPDGMPVAWALRSFGVAGQERVAGPDVMLGLTEQAARLHHRIFLYGSTEETLARLRTRLLGQFPGLDIAGSISPPFRNLSPEEDEADIRSILGAGTDELFVSLGSPKQERWIAAHRDRLPGVILLGVGAAFDFLAGRIPRAPRWMQRAGLEWLFRLGLEPTRLWKRYLGDNPRFLVLWAHQWLSRRK